jgi:hypothetical protein
MQLPGGYKEAGTQPAIAVDSQRLVAFAAIGMAATAGIAVLAIQVRFDGGALSGPHIRDALTDGDDFNSKLVPWNARITEKGHLAQKPAEIGSANADAMHAHQRFARTGFGRLSLFDHAEGVRLFQLNGFHIFCAFNYFPPAPPHGRDS